MSSQLDASMSGTMVQKIKQITAVFGFILRKVDEPERCVQSTTTYSKAEPKCFRQAVPVCSEEKQAIKIKEQLFAFYSACKTPEYEVFNYFLLL